MRTCWLIAKGHKLHFFELDTRDDSYILVCMACGVYAATDPKSLCKQCMGQPANQGAKARLTRVCNLRHPTLGVPLRPGLSLALGF